MITLTQNLRLKVDNASVPEFLFSSVIGEYKIGRRPGTRSILLGLFGFFVVVIFFNQHSNRWDGYSVG